MNNIVTIFNKSKAAMFLIPVGIMLIIFSLLMIFIDNKNKDYIKIDAIVSKTELYEDSYTDADGNFVEATYTVYVKYNVDGIDYETELGVLPGYKEGDTVNITYNPKDPKQISMPSSIIIKLLMLIGGIIALGGGIISIIKTTKNIKELANNNN